MRSIKIYLFSILICNSIYSQNTKIDSLFELTKLIDIKISKLSKQKNEILAIIDESKKIVLANEIKDSKIFVKTTISLIPGKLRNNSGFNGEILTTIPKGEEVEVYLNNFSNPYFLVSYKGINGYLSYASLNTTPEINSVIENDKIEKKAEIIRAEAEIIRAEYEKEVKLKNILKKELTVKYGEEIASRLILNKYWLGMTSKMALISLGNPVDINRTVALYGTHEQWVYNKDRNKTIYLYFENEILVTIQD